MKFKGIITEEWVLKHGFCPDAIATYKAVDLLGKPAMTVLEKLKGMDPDKLKGRFLINIKSLQTLISDYGTVELDNEGRVILYDCYVFEWQADRVLRMIHKSGKQVSRNTWENNLLISTLTPTALRSYEGDRLLSTFRYPNPKTGDAGLLIHYDTDEVGLVLSEKLFFPSSGKYVKTVYHSYGTGESFTNKQRN